jgi:glycine cleavage system aminomethyltransferase T
VIVDPDIQKLIDTFADAAHKHHRETLEGTAKKVNVQAKRITHTFHQIIVKGEVARKALLQLTKSEDIAVAKMAAVFSLKYATEEATVVLRGIAQRPDLLGFEAKQALKRWEEGTWQLE